MPEPRATGLQTIFGFFLGLMVTSFIGVGVYTFYPPPDAPLQERMTALSRQQQEIRATKAPDNLSPDDREKIQALQREIDAIQDESRAAGEAWGRRTSIILIALATLAMAVSLIRAVQLPVISNGLLLGGVFTMVYGCGWIIATDSSTARFFVMTAALAITIGLGYVRFVRQQSQAPAESVAPGPVAGNVSDLERRVRSLEDKMTRAAGALGSDREQ
jgi:uncharacterized protein HemX